MTHVLQIHVYTEPNVSIWKMIIIVNAHPIWVGKGVTMVNIVVQILVKMEGSVKRVLQDLFANVEVLLEPIVWLISMNVWDKIHVTMAVLASTLWEASNANVQQEPYWFVLKFIKVQWTLTNSVDGFFHQFWIPNLRIFLRDFCYDFFFNCTNRKQKSWTKLVNQIGENIWWIHYLSYLCNCISVS